MYVNNVLSLSLYHMYVGEVNHNVLLNWNEASQRCSLPTVQNRKPQCLAVLQEALLPPKSIKYQGITNPNQIILLDQLIFLTRNFTYQTVIRQNHMKTYETCWTSMLNLNVTPKIHVKPQCLDNYHVKNDLWFCSCSRYGKNGRFLLT